MTYTAPLTGMPDPVVLSTMTPDLMNAADACAGSGSSATWGTALRAYFYPVRLSQPHTYVKAWWLNGATAAGNVDVGIYTLAAGTLTRVVASTAEAQGTVSTLQVAAAFTTTTIGPGLYWLGMSCSLSTATAWKTTPDAALLRGFGVFMVSTAHPLPATATPATNTAGSVPVFGFSESAAI